MEDVLERCMTLPMKICLLFIVSSIKSSQSVNDPEKMDIMMALFLLNLCHGTTGND